MSSRWFRRNTSRSNRESNRGPMSGFLSPKANNSAAARTPLSAGRTAANNADLKKGDQLGSQGAGVDAVEDDNIKVLVRIRPPNETEMMPGYAPFATRSGSSVIAREPENGKRHEFNFDVVFGESSTQEDIFIAAGLPVVENCISGYNASVFCYGQTGAGKTFTMQGRNLHLKEGNVGHEDRGLMPRVFEHVFNRISEEEDRKGRDSLRYSVRCSFLEIYNETITDLLHPASKNLQMREDLKRGCYVQGLSEQDVLNGHDTMVLMRKGIENRRVAHTKMNRESSRSHSVLTLTIESKTKNYSGMTVSKFSRLNLIDLAGSERNKASGAEGDRLKEASSINKSLSQLGLVIMRLVEQQRDHDGRAAVHVPYRDSKLTFLLQESLGGNAKTFMIANISPAPRSSGETMSTMRFATGAKSIVNKAKVNEEASGDIATLQEVIKNLRKELDMYRNGEAVELRALLSSEQEAKAKALDDLDKKAREINLLQQKVASLGRQMADADGNRDANETFQIRVAHSIAAASSKQPEAALSIGNLDALAEAVELSMEQLKAVETDAADVRAEAETLAERLSNVESSLESEAAQVSSARDEISRLNAERAELQEENVKLAAQLARVNEELGAAHLHTKQLNKLADARILEKQKLQETLQIVESTAKEHEFDLLQEIERLERQAVERQESIVDILAIADRFRHRQQETTTPFKTPGAGKTNPSVGQGGPAGRAGPKLRPAAENVRSRSPLSADIGKGEHDASHKSNILPKENAENDFPSPAVMPSPPPPAARTSFAERLSLAIPEYEDLVNQSGDSLAVLNDESMISIDGSSVTRDGSGKPAENPRYHNTYSNPILNAGSPLTSPGIRESIGQFRGGTKAQSILRISQALRSKAKALLHSGNMQSTSLGSSSEQPMEAV